MSKHIETWEGEGGAAPRESGISTASGTAAQVEWAQRIKRHVNADFDRVASAFRKVSGTEAIIAILEEKRAEVMSNEQAGYFIHDWQEIGDQVRKMVSRDPRYAAIRSHRAARRPTAS